MRLQKHLIFATTLLTACFFVPSGVFAAEGNDTTKPVMKTSVLPDTTSASGSEESTGAIAERQKTYDNMNTLLIQSYKTKLDKILSDVYDSVENVAKEDPALQAAILEKIAEEIDKKMEGMEKQGVSPNRKKILVSIFTYLKSDILTKAEDLKQKGK